MKKESFEEKRCHSSMLVPYSYYRGTMPDEYPATTLHWHNEFEVCEILSGSCFFRCGGKVFTAQKDDIIVIAPNIIHSLYPVSGESMTNDALVFHANILTGNCEDRPYHEILQPIISGQSVINAPITKENPYYGEIRRSIDSVFSCARSNTAVQDMLIKSELMKIFWLLLKSGDIHSAENDAVKLSESIRPAVKYIDEHYSEDITVDILSETVHLSKSYFICRFKRAVGMSPIDYVNQIRIKEVCRQLSATSKQITDIAFDCGFRNISNFNRQFVKIVGCRPMEYRKGEK